MSPMVEEGMAVVLFVSNDYAQDPSNPEAGLKTLDTDLFLVVSQRKVVKNKFWYLCRFSLL